MPEIKNVKYNNRAKTTSTIIKNAERVLDTSLVQFVEATPIECNYYSIDLLASTTGTGFNDVSGPYDGATKYKFIKNFHMYGYNEVKELGKDEKEETDIQVVLAENSSLVLPGTLLPKPGDRLTLHIENNAIFYRVIRATETTLHNKPFYKVDWEIDKSLPRVDWSHKDMTKANLITDELEFIAEHIGTNYSCFLKSDFYEKIKRINNYRDDINEEYIDFFYDEYRNILTFDGDDRLRTRNYITILNDYQMEFKPLYVYDVNMVLHHETIMDNRSVVNWKRNPLRKFINRKRNNLISEGLGFSTYIYTTSPNDPNYKLLSYLNDTRFYKIYDYGVEEEYIKIPENFIDIFERYEVGTLSINYLLDVLDGIELDISQEYLLYTPILLSIIDRYVAESIAQADIDRFY